MKRDEVLPALAAGDELAVDKVMLDAKQTEPPARYSQGKLVQEMERLGLGTKSTRASIIERLYEVKYLKNDPIEPSQLGIAIIDALSQYANHITTPDMTSQLEDDMTSVAAGEKTEETVVTHSRELLSGLLDGLIEHKDDLGNAISDAVTADAKVGVCPKCGHDLLVKTSAKNHSQFVGCSAWPECDVTYPLPKGRIEPVEERCPTCGGSQIKVHPFKAKAYVVCLDPACPSNKEPDVDVGPCKVCQAAGRDGRLIAHRSDRTLKRFIRCTNYDECGVSYPLPQRGKLEATGQECPDCGAPMVIIHTARGPWKICVNMECPGKQREKDAKGTRGARGAKSSGSKTVRSSKSTRASKAARATKTTGSSKASRASKAGASKGAKSAAEEKATENELS
jgi:DNA topoisomerase-1